MAHPRSVLGGPLIVPTFAYLRTPEGSMVANGEYVCCGCHRVMAREADGTLRCTCERAPYQATWQLEGPPAP